MLLSNLSNLWNNKKGEVFFTTKVKEINGNTRDDKAVLTMRSSADNAQQC